MRFTFHLAAAVAATLTATAVAAAQTGNGAPSGSHYNLNIIGVSHDKNPNMNGNGSGNVIFVDLGTKSGVAVTTKILLSQTADGVFEVLDKNGTDGEASFALPAPGSSTVWATPRSCFGRWADSRTSRSPSRSSRSSPAA